MNDFKIGDDVYYFCYSDDSSIVWDLNNFCLRRDKITGIDSLGNPMFDNYYCIREGEPFFKTKYDAIATLLERLMRMLDE